MTTLTLKTFASKLGFTRVSDPQLQLLMRQWSIDGSIKVYQGGYRGHSTAHPKKVCFVKPLDVFQKVVSDKDKETKFSIDEAKHFLAEYGLKIVTASEKSYHNCSNPKCKLDIKAYQQYATGTFFLQVKLCPHCIREMCSGANFMIHKPEIIIDETKELV